MHDSSDNSAQRREFESLEAPAHLGRPFPGTGRHPRRYRSGALAALCSLGGLALLGASINFLNGNTIAGFIFVAVLVAAAVAGFFVVRSEVRRAMKDRPGSGNRHRYRY